MSSRLECRSKSASAGGMATSTMDATATNRTMTGSRDRAQDPNLPNGGGYTVTGFVLFPQVFSPRTTSHAGRQLRHADGALNGADFTATSRLRTASSCRRREPGRRVQISAMSSASCPDAASVPRLEYDVVLPRGPSLEMRPSERWVPEPGRGARDSPHPEGRDDQRRSEPARSDRTANYTAFDSGDARPSAISWAPPHVSDADGTAQSDHP